MKKTPLLLLVLIAVVPAITLSAKKKEETAKAATTMSTAGKGEGATKRTKKAGKPFTPEEREILEDWQSGQGGWKKQGKSLPPGLQKKVDRGGELPPGWARKLEIGETLPPDLDKTSIRLPNEILKRLPEIEDGMEIIQIGEEIIRVFEDTREIVDILSRRPEKD